MRCILSALFGCLALSGIPAAFAQQTDDLSGAKALIRLNHFEQAQQSLDEYVRAHPTSANAKYLLAYVLFRRDRPRESLRVYTAAAALQRPTPDDFKIVGLDYVLLNDYSDAIRWLERSVAEGPNEAEAVYYLGRAYYVQNDFDKAIAAFERALQLDPQYAKAENNLGLALAAKNQPGPAEAAYRKAIQLGKAANKESDQPYLNLADLLSHTNRRVEALPYLDTAERLGGISEKAEELRGQILFAQNRLGEAETAFRKAIELQSSNASLHFLLGRVLKREGKPEDAEKEFTRSKALLGTHSSSPQQTQSPKPSDQGQRVETLQRAAALIAQHQLEPAAQILQPLLSQSPDDPLALNLLGVVRMQEHQTDEAEALFQKAIHSGDKIAGPHVNLARLYGAARPLDAIAQIKAALTVAPGDKDAVSLLRQIAKDAALAAMQAGDKQKAAAVLSKAAETFPHDPELLYEFGFVAFESGLYHDSEQSLKEALKLQPQFPKASYALARTYLAENLAEPAEKQMRAYLAEKPNDASAQYGLGYILMAEQRVDEAKAAFAKSLALQPRQTESLFELGEIALQQGQNEIAREDYEKVLAADPKHAGALTGSGELAFRAGRYPEAQADFERAIASAPSYQKAHYYYALTLLKLGQKAQAEHEFAISKQLQKVHGSEPRLAAQP